MYALILSALLSAMAVTTTMVFSYQNYGVFYYSPLMEQTIKICLFGWATWFYLVDLWLFERIPSTTITETPAKIVPFGSREGSQKILVWRTETSNGTQHFNVLERTDHYKNVYPRSFSTTIDLAEVIEDSTLADLGTLTRIYTQKDSSSTICKWLLCKRFSFSRELLRTEVRIPVGSLRPAD